MEQRYVNRSILYTVYLADEQKLNLKRSNIVSMLKGKNYPIINRLSPNFITYAFLYHMSSKYIGQSLDEIHQKGYLEERYSEDKGITSLHTTEKGYKQVQAFINDKFFMEQLRNRN